MCCVFYSYVIFLNLLSFVITPNSVPAYHLIKTVFQQIERKKLVKWLLIFVNCFVLIIIITDKRGIYFKVY